MCWRMVIRLRTPTNWLDSLASCHEVEAPTSNFQAPEKLQHPNTEGCSGAPLYWFLVLGASLEAGTRCLVLHLGSHSRSLSACSRAPRAFTHLHRPWQQAGVRRRCRGKPYSGFFLFRLSDTTPTHSQCSSTFRAPPGLYRS